MLFRSALRAAGRAAALRAGAFFLAAAFFFAFAIACSLGFSMPGGRPENPHSIIAFALPQGGAVAYNRAHAYKRGLKENRMAPSPADRKLNQPMGGNEMTRAGGPATMMRLPMQKDAAGLDACFVGIPLDWGASNRSGTRMGPRYIRVESSLIQIGRAHV